MRGRPWRVIAADTAAQAPAPSSLGQARLASISREWSSSTSKITTVAPSARVCSNASICQQSLLAGNSKRR
jgi:hypothetical protein